MRFLSGRFPMQRAPAPPEHAVAGYLPGLDAIRLVAVSIVISRHYQFSKLIPGGFGVTVFFFISGLLITRLLLAEEKRSGPNKKSFYIRRFIRLLPPLILMLAITVPIYILLHVSDFRWLQVGSATLYLGNIHAMLADYQVVDRGLSGYRILWSLAVEEHFYLLFPFLLAATKTRVGRIRALSLLIAGCTALRLLAYLGWGPAAQSFNYNFTFTRLDSIAWGCLLSIVLDGPNPLSRLRTPFITILATLLLLVSIAIQAQWMEDIVQFIIQGAMLALIANYVIFSPAAANLRAIAEWRPLQMGGRISYELYLWHFHVFTILGIGLGYNRISTALSLLLTIVISYSSYKITQPLSQLRRRYGAHPVEAERQLYLKSTN